jgi:GT2 family glycosyltransferase
MSKGVIGRVSVSLLTYDGRRWIEGCLESLANQTHPDIELIVIDNGSKDGTADWLRERLASLPNATFVEVGTNTGFARGHNQGIARATGEHVCLLNQDVLLDPEFLAGAAKALAREPRAGAVQAKVYTLLADGVRSSTIDTTGLVLHRDRRMLSRGQGAEDTGQYDDRIGVFGDDGPCPVYRRAALDDAREPRGDGGWEYLDEQFFLYHEDTDLAWRLRTLGWDTLYEPDAVAWHARGFTAEASNSVKAVARHHRGTSRSANAYAWRNRRLMIVKNDTASLLIPDLPWLVWRELASLALMVVTDPRRLARVRDLVVALPATLRKRRWIQRHRRVAPSELRRWIT